MIDVQSYMVLTTTLRGRCYCYDSLFVGEEPEAQGTLLKVT